MVSVTRLCCPACWKLLTILCEDEPPLSLRGCHTQVFALELPGWIPAGIVEKMNAHFQNSLRQELETMMSNEAEHEAQAETEAKIRQKGHFSHLSESNISVASTSTPVIARHDDYAPVTVTPVTN
jgi:hypothetical protein